MVSKCWVIFQNTWKIYHKSTYNFTKFLVFYRRISRNSWKNHNVIQGTMLHKCRTFTSGNDCTLDLCAISSHRTGDLTLKKSKTCLWSRTRSLDRCRESALWLKSGKHGNGEIITNKSHAILNINEIPRVDSNQSVTVIKTRQYAKIIWPF